MRILPLLNMGMWTAQAVTSYAYAHSLGLALLGLVGIVVACLQYRAEMSR